MDTARPFDDDPDLDALMSRVRDAALGGLSDSGPLQLAAGEADADGLEVMKVLEAQGSWNEQVRQSLVALLDGLRTLRDDWAAAQAELRRELGRLSAVADGRGSAAPAMGTLAGASGGRRSGTARVAAPYRHTRKRRPKAGRRSRS